MGPYARTTIRAPCQRRRARASAHAPLAAVVVVHGDGGATRRFGHVRDWRACTHGKRGPWAGARTPRYAHLVNDGGPEQRRTRNWRGGCCRDHARWRGAARTVPERAPVERVVSRALSSVLPAGRSSQKMWHFRFVRSSFRFRLSQPHCKKRKRWNSAASARHRSADSAPCSC